MRKPRRKERAPDSTAQKPPALNTPRHVHQPAEPRNSNQKGYLKAINSNDLTFGIGPAGTGKTFLAVSAAVTSLLQKKVARIILVRPAVEAGERLGFLPGSLQEKVDPFLRPIYDALYTFLGPEHTALLLEKNIIEIAPLAFMRGRTLDDAFVLMDEAQNTTPEQMKMFLTRLGNGSKMVVTGDCTQIDLARSQTSGLVRVLQLLDRHAVDSCHVHQFTAGDVVRHPLVQQLVEMYEAIEQTGG